MNKRFALVCETENDEPVIHQRASRPGDATAVLEVVVGKTINEWLLARDRYSNVLRVAGGVTSGVQDHRGIRVKVSCCIEGIRGHFDVDLLGS